VHDLSTTLAAVASAPGRGGVACIRVSGPDAYRVAAGLFRSKRHYELPGDGRPLFGSFVGTDSAALDHGFLVAFTPGRAFTGEPTVELWTHGSPPVLQALLRAAVALGATLAGPGEFTYRALRHGRLDLPRAEAIRDLIDARTIHQARMALAQAEGALSRRLGPLREALIDLAARGEAAVEFADESETHLEDGAFRKGVGTALHAARSLLEEGRRGRVIRDGARVVLAGVTNVGKSSIFNRLVGRDRAIVSSAPGTTRDTLEETIDVAGIPVTLVDTAGRRASDDAIESEGMRRARAAAGTADMLIRVIDATRPLTADEEDDLRGDAAAAVPVIVVVNKIDAAPAREPIAAPPGAIPLSAADGEGFPSLCEAIVRGLAGAPTLEQPLVSSARHLASLDTIVTSLAAARESAGLGVELALEDVRSALSELDELIGRVGGDDLYDRIFSTFCIGK